MEDLISRQAAVDAVKFGITHAIRINRYTGEKDDLFQASNDELEKAIERIKELPTVSVCTDAISRHEVLRTIDDRIEQLKRHKGEINKSYSHLSFAKGVHDGYCRLKCDLRILPPVSVAEKVGRWEWLSYDGANPKIGNYHCSICHSIGKAFYEYCPNCGARMEVEE